MDLTGIKVKIGLTDNKHKYPDFNQLPVVVTSGVNWSHYVDMYGLGWCYDKVTGHKDHTVDSPFGEWHGCLLVPKQFAAEAISTFPLECSPLTEVEYQDFYDNKAMIRTGENKYDDQALSNIDKEVSNLQKLSDETPANTKLKSSLDSAKIKMAKALDPADDTPGVRKNDSRYWVDHKAKSGITYV